jgi:hypothetical protein
MKDNFMYKSVDIIKNGNKKTVRKVSVKNGKGFKSISKFKNGKHIGTAKKKIEDEHIGLIKGGTFIKDLFGDCKCNKSKKTRKNRF